MNTYRPTEDSQFQQFNQGEYGDAYKVKQVWNGPVATAFGEDNGGVCETFRMEVPAKRKIWEMALYHTMLRAGRSSYFLFLRERYATTPRKLEENTPSAGEPTEWTLSKWNMDDARGLVPEVSENAGDGLLQWLSASSESVTGSVLQQQFNTLTETNTKRILQTQCSNFFTRRNAASRRGYDYIFLKTANPYEGGDYQ